MSTSIPYLDVLYNPVTGCKPDFQCWGKCWARNLAHRFNQIGTPAGDFVPTFHADKLAQPLHWRKPRRVGVCFTGDLFVDGITDEQIAAVFGVMAACPQHRFFVLTKRAKRMERWFVWAYDTESTWTACHAAALCHDDAADTIHRRSEEAPGRPWPLPNVYLGVSVSTQADADERIPHLMRCPAAVHWVSVEPMLEGIDLRKYLYCGCCSTSAQNPCLSWCVVAAESGPRARPLNLQWVRDLQYQCEKSGTPLAFKSQTGYPPLDGKYYDEMPREPR